MDLAELETFIVEAKANTYVGGSADAGPSRPGSHDLEYARGDWRYRDSYFGGSDFLGEEVVWHRGVPVWAMNYYGWISDPAAITAETAGRVIRTALSAMYSEVRFLGGFHTEVDGWVYHDHSAGDLTHFHGRERISRPDGPEVYALLYHGGLIRPD